MSTIISLEFPKSCGAEFWKHNSHLGSKSTRSSIIFVRLILMFEAETNILQISLFTEDEI